MGALQRLGGGPVEALHWIRGSVAVAYLKLSGRCGGSSGSTGGSKLGLYYVCSDTSGGRIICI